MLDDGRRLLRRLHLVLKYAFDQAAPQAPAMHMTTADCCVCLFRPTAFLRTLRPQCEVLAADPQAQKLLEVRREHLRRLHRIYEDRRQVNLEAISVLVGGPSYCSVQERCNIAAATSPCPNLMSDVHQLDSSRSRVWDTTQRCQADFKRS